MQLIVKTDFRHLGISYPVGKKPVDLPEDVAALALKEGWAVDMKEVKTAPENKAVLSTPENKQLSLAGAPANADSGQQDEDPQGS